MSTRLFAAALLIVALALQYRLWLSDDGIREVHRLQDAVASQRQQNAELQERNEQLAAEVKDLKEGLDAVEERARSDLGMVGANETFYQVVAPPPADHGSPPQAAPIDSSTVATAKPRTTQQAAAR
ncbi:MAG TPA: cell division protein FtsB [Steroidobacteraceae bacterium]|nr:cell division protein FtsB [Steroidobacteraceae bacterium]